MLLFMYGCIPFVWLDYGFVSLSIPNQIKGGGDNCSGPIAPTNSAAFLTLRWLFGVALLCVVAAYAIFATVVLAMNLRGRRDLCTRASMRKFGLIFLIYALCFMSAFIRIFYFALDPYCYRLELSYCAFYAIDYVSSALVAMAYALLTFNWLLVLKKTMDRKWRPLVLALQVWAIVSAISLIVAPCAIAWYCVCPDGVCDYARADNMYYSMFLIAQGTNSIIQAASGCIIIAS